MEIQIDRLSNVEQLDQVDTAAAAFDRGDDRLHAAEPLGELSLAEAGGLPLFDDQADEADVTGRAKGCRHPPLSAVEFGPTGRVSGFSDYRKIWL